MSRTNHQPNLPRDEERDLTQDSRPNSIQAICTEPNRDANHREDNACIHPISRKNNYRREDKPSNSGVVWKFSKRTVNVTEYRNRNDKVNPAKNRTFGGGLNHLVLFIEN